MVWYGLGWCSDLLLLPVSKLGGRYKYLAGSVSVSSK